MNTVTTLSGTSTLSNTGTIGSNMPPVSSSLPSNPVPTNMLSFRFATPNSTQTPYYISSDIVLSGGIAQQNRRRIVHNEVEKRRKDKITNWIKKLAELLPRHRVTKQSKNYVLETACEYIEELNQMSIQFTQLKLSKEVLEQEVNQLRNKVNKLEDENKRLSQLILENKVSLPNSWSDSSIITTTMRATSASRESNNAQVRGTTGSTIRATGSSLSTSTVATSTLTNCLSVTSILSSTSKKHVTTTIQSRQRNHDRPMSTLSISKNSPVSTSTQKRLATYSKSQSSASKSGNRTSAINKRINNPEVVEYGSGSTTLPATSTQVSSVTHKSSETSPIRTSNTIGQHSFMSQPQTAMVLSVANMSGILQLAQQQPACTASTSTGDKSFPQMQQMRSMGASAPQDNISQLPYSIDALTGNLTSQSRQQSSATGNPLTFSAESLIGRQQGSSDVVMLNNPVNPVNQPVIQNTFTLTHRPTGNPSATPTSVAPQSFSNFSALSLVGNTETFSANANPVTRSTSTVPDSGTLPQSSGNIFTDFSTESLIGQSEFSSDFAIDNLISRSDSSAHMATVNPNLIQTFGKGNDPMISSVSADHATHISHNFEPPGLNIGSFTSHTLFPYW